MGWSALKMTEFWTPTIPFLQSYQPYTWFAHFRNFKLYYLAASHAYTPFSCTVTCVKVCRRQILPSPIILIFKKVAEALLRRKIYLNWPFLKKEKTLDISKHFVVILVSELLSVKKNQKPKAVKETKKQNETLYSPPAPPPQKNFPKISFCFSQTFVGKLLKYHLLFTNLCLYKS